MPFALVTDELRVACVAVKGETYDKMVSNSATNRDCDVDQPRNLAKSVTVE